jgi:maleamate amidohydrolase
VTTAGNPHGDAFAHRLGWGARPALVVIDMVRAYTEPDGPFALPEPGPALDACVSLVDAARSGGAPVVWTVVRYTSGLADGGLFVRKVPALAAFAEDAPGDWGDIAKPLRPEPTEPVVAKQYASAFAGTSLAATLAVAGVDTLVVCGVSTSGCVRATATDAMAHGLRPMVVGAACADRTVALHDANLADLDAKYADVVAVDAARDALAATA